MKKNRTVLKAVLYIVLGYFLLQMSIEAKRIEENESIPHMETTVELLDEYTENKYVGDWRIIGHDFQQDRRAYVGTLNLRTDKDIMIVCGTRSLYLVPYDYEVNEMIFGIMFHYGVEDDISVDKEVDGEYISYTIEYEDKYIPNLEMEEAFGISTEEVVESVNETCRIIEEELQSMHAYQIDKARKVRGILATIGAIGFALYVWLKRSDTDTGDGKEKSDYKRYFFRMGLVACFWTYMFRPIISQFILFWVNGETNRYVAYAASAVVVGSLLCVVGVKRMDSHAKPETKRQMIFRIVLGITICTILIRIGVAIVSNFYFYEWKTYLLNFIAAGCAIRIYERFHNLKTKKIDNQMLS